MNARVNASHFLKKQQWTFEHSVPAERIRSIGTVRPVRTLVGSFQMRQRGRSHNPTKPFQPKRKEGFQSCLYKQRKNSRYDCMNNQHPKGLHSPALWRRSYIHTLGALPQNRTDLARPARGGGHTFTPFRRHQGRSDGEGWGGFQRAEETARFPALWPPSPARHVTLCFQAKIS